MMVRPKGQKPTRIEIVEEAGRRVLISTFANGEVTRTFLDELEKPKRRRFRPYQKVGMDRTRKKRF